MFFHRALQDRKLFVIPDIHYFDAHRLRAHLLQAQELQLYPRASNLVGPDGAGDAVEDPSSDEERDTTDAKTDAETAAEEAWCLRCPTRQTTLLRVRSLVITWVSSIGEYFLPAGQSWRIAGFVAAGKIDYLADFNPRQICQVVHDHCSRTVVVRED